MSSIVSRVAIALAVCSLGCAATPRQTPQRWDYVDTQAGIYFSLPPGWAFLPEDTVEAMVAGFGAGATRAHFAAVREETRQLNYPDGIVVFSSPPPADTHTFTLAQACERLFGNAPIVDSSGTRLFAKRERFCAIKPDPTLGLEGTLYLLVSRAELIFVMTFAPTAPVETQAQDALARLLFEP